MIVLLPNEICPVGETCKHRGDCHGLKELRPTKFECNYYEEDLKVMRVNEE